MLRIGLTLLLTVACAQAMAQNGRNAAPEPGACPESDALAREDATTAAGAHPRVAATRNKYTAAKPAVAPANNSIGGGGSDDDAMQRPRAPKWHSFLPGMFR